MRPFVRSLIQDMYLRNVHVLIIARHLIDTGLNKAATPASVLAVVHQICT